MPRKYLLPILVVFVFVASFLVAKNISFGPVMPPEISKYENDWPTANQNLSNTRSTSSSSINLSNVSKLGPAWTFPIKGVSEWGSAATNPLILGGTVYFQDLKSNVYAVDALSGKQIWM